MWRRGAQIVTSWSDRLSFARRKVRSRLPAQDLLEVHSSTPEPERPSSPERVRATAENRPDLEGVQALCWWWQARIALQDWTVEVEYVPLGELDHRGQGAQVEYLEEARLATIRILEPSHRLKHTTKPYDIEEQLVHELLHLHFLPFDRRKLGRRLEICQEQVINALAKALVELRRDGRDGSIRIPAEARMWADAPRPARVRDNRGPMRPDGNES